MRRTYLDTRHYNMPYKNVAVQGFGQESPGGVLDDPMFGEDEYSSLYDDSGDALDQLLAELDGGEQPIGTTPGAVTALVPQAAPPVSVPAAPPAAALGPVLTRADLDAAVLSMKRSIMLHSLFVAGIAIAADFFLRPKR